MQRTSPELSDTDTPQPSDSEQMMTRKTASRDELNKLPDEVDSSGEMGRFPSSTRISGGPNTAMPVADRQQRRQLADTDDDMTASQMSRDRQHPELNYDSEGDPILRKSLTDIQLQGSDIIGSQLHQQPVITTQRDKPVDINWPMSDTASSGEPSPTMQTMRNEPINMEWTAPQPSRTGNYINRQNYNSQQPGKDRQYLPEAEATHRRMRPRDAPRPQRVHSIASSDITPSIDSMSSNDQFSPVYTGRPVRPASPTSSDATLTDNERMPPYRGRRLQTMPRDHVRRTSQPPNDQQLEARPTHVTEYIMTAAPAERHTPLRLYAGRGPTPVSGRQKIRRSTGSFGDEQDLPRDEQMSQRHVAEALAAGRRSAGPFGAEQAFTENGYDEPITSRRATTTRSAGRRSRGSLGDEHDLPGNGYDDGDPMTSRRITPTQAAGYRLRGPYGDEPAFTGNSYDEPMTSRRAAAARAEGNRPRGSFQDEPDFLGNGYDEPMTSRQIPTAHAAGNRPRRPYGDEPDLEVNGYDELMTSRNAAAAHAAGRYSITPTPSRHSQRAVVPFDDDVVGRQQRPSASNRQPGNVDIRIINSGDVSDPDFRVHKMPATGREKMHRAAASPLTVDIVPVNQRSHMHRSMPNLMNADYSGDDDDDMIQQTRRGRVNEAAPPPRQANYYSDLEEADSSRPVYMSTTRRQRVLETESPRTGLRPGRLTTSITDLPSHTDTTVRYQQQQQQLLPVMPAPVLITSRPASQVYRRALRAGSTADVIGRKRGYITNAGVEDTGRPSRRSGRRNDRAATDIEDLDDDVDQWQHRRISRRQRSSYMARVQVGDEGRGFESDDAMSVFSEPAVLLRSRSISTLPLYSRPTTPVIEYRPALATQPSAQAQPLFAPPAFTLANVDTRINTLSPGMADVESIEAVDPELKGASKKGTNYHITLTLKPLVSTRPASSMQTGLMTSVNDVTQYRAQTPVQRTPSYSSSHIETSSVVQTPVIQLPVLRPASRARSLHTSSVRTHSRIDTANDEITIEPIHSASRPRTPRRSRSQQQTEGQIGFDIEVQSDDEPVDDITLMTANHMTLQAADYKVPLNSSLEINYSPQNNIDHRYNEQYIDETYRRTITDEHLPKVERRSFLIRNLPKVLILFGL